MPPCRRRQPPPEAHGGLRARRARCLPHARRKIHPERRRQRRRPARSLPLLRSSQGSGQSGRGAWRRLCAASRSGIAERASEAERLRSGAVREAAEGGVIMDQVYIILAPNGSEKAKRAFVVETFQDVFDFLLALGKENAKNAEVYRASRLKN